MLRKLLFITMLFIVSVCNAAGLKDGEYLLFDIRYGLVSAAEASLELKSVQYQGQAVWQIASNAKTYSFFDVFFRVRDRVESLWSKDKMLPLRFTKNLEEGKYRQFRIHAFDHQKLKTEYQKWDYKANRWNNTILDFPKGTQDVLSAFYLVRTMDLSPGKSVFVNITTDGRSLDTEVVVHRKETITSIFGKKECLVIEPRLAGEGVFKQSGRIWIWITNDAHKVPLKMKSQITFGSFIAELKSARNTGLN